MRWHWWKQEFRHNLRRQVDKSDLYNEENGAFKEEFQISSLRDQKNKDNNLKNGERKTVDKFKICWPENICKHKNKESQDLKSSDVSFVFSRVRAKTMMTDVPSRILRGKREGSIWQRLSPQPNLSHSLLSPLLNYASSLGSSVHLCSVQF